MVCSTHVAASGIHSNEPFALLHLIMTHATSNPTRYGVGTPGIVTPGSLPHGIHAEDPVQLLQNANAFTADSTACHERCAFDVGGLKI